MSAPVNPWPSMSRDPHIPLWLALLPEDHFLPLQKDPMSEVRTAATFLRRASKAGRGQAARGPGRRAGSGQEQAKPQFGRLLGDDVVVAFGPPVRGEVVAQFAHRPFLRLRPE